MTESKYVEAKKIHEQMEKINDFLESAKKEEVKTVDIICGSGHVVITKGSQVYTTIIDFLEKALLQYDDKFKNL